jgi:hypothetical protein
MKMKRKQGIALALVLCLTFAISACEPDSEATPDPTPDPAPDLTADSCLSEIRNFKTSGSYRVTSEKHGDVNVYLPRGLEAGCRVPIIHLANGTGASCSNYESTLEHFASHGFIAACYEDEDTGQGTQAIDAINRVKREYPDMVDNKYGFTGHSQGGGGAIMAVYRAEQEWGDDAIYAGFGIEPAHGYGDSPFNWKTYYGRIDSPVSMFNGSSDALVSESWVRDGYDALDGGIEKAWYEAVGAGHMTPIPNSEASEFGLAWFAWQLLGQSNACQYFKDMPDSYDWRLQEEDNLSRCN